MQRRGVAYEQPLRYAGQYQDNESGLHDNPLRCIRTIKQTAPLSPLKTALNEGGERADTCCYRRWPASL
ncbi:protein of unknown function [Serratia sp. Tan611]|nr:protein of unknown function [Serratia sp. Tan611]